MQIAHVETSTNHAFGPLTLRAPGSGGAARQRNSIHQSVESVLKDAYRAAAASGVKTAKLGESTSPDSSGTRLSLLEQKGDAKWVFRLMDEHLDATQRAWVDATYDGMGATRSRAIATLALHFEHINANRGLMAGLVQHVLDFNEDYCKSCREIERDAGVPRMTANRAKMRVIDAMVELGDTVERQLRPQFERRGWLTRAA